MNEEQPRAALVPDAATGCRNVTKLQAIALYHLASQLPIVPRDSEFHVRRVCAIPAGYTVLPYPLTRGAGRLVRAGLAERILPWKTNGARLYRLTTQGHEAVEALPDDIYQRHQTMMAEMAERRRRTDEYYAAVRRLLQQSVTGEISVEEGEARALYLRGCRR